MLKKLLFTLGQIYQSLLFALESVVINKLRTALSLFGITIGVFTIITVFSLVDSMELKIREGVETINTQSLYIGQWPWDNIDGEWWRYANRPSATMNEANELQALLPHAEAIVFTASFSRTATHGKNYLDDTPIVSASHDYDQTRSIDIDNGRYFTPYESAHAARVAIIGATVAEKLYGIGINPIGEELRVAGIKLTVIGTFRKEGTSITGTSSDETILIPASLASNLVNMRWATTEIIVKGADNGNMEDFRAEVASLMRRIRRLSPQTEDNFSVNEVSLINSQLDQMFGTISLAGGIIGIFSILVGGFGVANIMFVSVKERTPQIGIQKALGARPYFILLQFVFEATLLSILGGIIGLLLIFLGFAVVNNTVDMGGFQLVLTFENIVLGLAISSAVGAIAGFFPAWSAARMEPVKAIFNT